MKNLIIASFILITSLTLFGCFGKSEEEKLVEEKQQKEEKIREGKYLYIDSGGVAHIDLNCSRIGSDIIKRVGEDEYEYSLHSVKRVLKTEVTQEMLDKCCKRCISDEDYEILESKVNVSAQSESTPIEEKYVGRVR